VRHLETLEVELRDGFGQLLVKLKLAEDVELLYSLQAYFLVRE